MMIPFHKKRICLAAKIALTAQILLLLYWLTFSAAPMSPPTFAANSTLGFGKIYAVTRTGSLERQFLLRAAHRTNIDVITPRQPAWTEQDIKNLRAPVNSTVSRKSALAWLGHRNALETFVQSSHETALIVEDDVDWDVRLRTQQIPSTARAIRELVASSTSYYGDPTLWDIIWLGHCGDFFDATQGSELSSIKAFSDPTVPPLDDLHPWTRDFLLDIGVDQDYRRLVHQSVQPLCTFAYAVTQQAAKRILYDHAFAEPVRDPAHPCSAYDVRLLEACRDEGLRCISVNPELFHHSGLGSQALRGSRPATPELGMGREPYTANIRCSARSGRWREIQDEIVSASSDPGSLSQGSATSPPRCDLDHPQ